MTASIITFEQFERGFNAIKDHYQARQAVEVAARDAGIEPVEWTVCRLMGVRL